MFVWLFAVVSLGEVCPNSSVDTGLSYPTDWDEYIVVDCSFSRFGVFDQSGGVISSISALVLNITSCVFIGCVTSESAGAIYFDSPQRGYSNIEKTCGYNCSCMKYVGEFSIIVAKTNINQKLVSICYCGNDISSNTESLRASIVDCSQINLSNCLAHSESGFAVTFYNEASITQSSFTSNHYRSLSMITMKGNSLASKIRLCNFVNDSTQNEYASLIVSSGSYISIETCVFQRNEGHLFGTIDHGFVQTIECWIAHIGDMFKYDNVTLISNLMMTTEPIKNEYFGTVHCPSDEFVKPTKSSLPDMTPFRTYPPDQTPYPTCITPDRTYSDNNSFGAVVLTFFITVLVCAVVGYYLYSQIREKGYQDIENGLFK